MRPVRPILTATALAAAVVVGSPLTASAAPGNGASGLPVQVIAMNDFHGRIRTQAGSDGELTTSPGPDGNYATTADNVVESVGAAADIATLRQVHEEFGGPRQNSFFVGAGDLISASPFNSSVFQDEPTIEVLNALGLDFSSVGNMAGTPIGDLNARMSSAVDVIISGHTHVPYDCALPDPAGSPRLVTQAGFYGKALTDIRFRLGSNGDVIRATGTATDVPVRRTAPDPAVQRIASYWEGRAAEAGNGPVGQQDADLDRAYLNGTAVRDSDSSLGNLVADAQLAAFPGADVAFMNPGGLRADINCASSGPDDPDGTITYAETFSVQPFSNTVDTVQLTGAAIEQVLEQVAAGARPRGVSMDPAQPFDDDRAGMAAC